MVLSLLIIGAVGSLYMMSSNASRTSTQLSSAEERGRLAMFFLGEPIALAGYGNLVGVNETRYENGSMTDAHVRVCANGRFTDPLNGDFTCVANASPGDQLYVSYQADSLPGLAPQGLMQDCLGQNPPNINGVPTVRNVYSVEQTGGGALEFGCTGNGGGARQTLVRDVEDFKVFFAFDRRNYELGRTTAQYNPRVVGSTLMTAAQIEALPGANLPASSLANPVEPCHRGLCLRAIAHAGGRDDTRWCLALPALPSDRSRSCHGDCRSSDQRWRSAAHFHTGVHRSCSHPDGVLR